MEETYMSLEGTRAVWEMLFENNERIKKLEEALQELTEQLANLRP